MRHIVLLTADDSVAPRWLKERECSWTREKSQWPPEPGPEEDSPGPRGEGLWTRRLQAIFPDYVPHRVGNFIEYNSQPETVQFARDELGLDLSRGLTLHPQSRFSFAQHASERLPEDWLVYFMDLCRGRVIWFAGVRQADDNHSLIGLVLPMPELASSDDTEERRWSREWDSGVIVQWDVSTCLPQPICYSWSDFVQLRAMTFEYVGDAPNRGCAGQQRKVGVWSQLPGDRQPPRVRNVSSTVRRAVAEELRFADTHLAVQLMFDDLLSTTVSAYSPGYAAFHQSDYERVRRRAGRKRRRRQHGDEAHH